MNKKVGKLIRLIGDDNLYQYLSLISLVLVWGSTLIVYNIDANFNCQLQYEDFGEEHYNWIKALKIECDNTKIGKIGLMNCAGFCLGALTFFLIKKVFALKMIAMLSIIGYSTCFLFMYFVSNYKELPNYLLLSGIFGFYANISLLILVEQTLSRTSRIFFFGISLLCSQYIAYFYVLLWIRYKIEIQTVHLLIIGEIIIALLFILIFCYNSPIEYIHSKEKDKLIDVLTGIAFINGKLDELNKEINNKDSTLLNDVINEGTDTLLNNINNIEPINGWSFLKKAELRYPFLLFCFLSLVIRGIYRGIAISNKHIINNYILDLSFFYTIECFAFIFIAQLMIARFSRKKFYFFLFGLLTSSFILFSLFKPVKILPLNIFICIDRFCLCGLLIVIYSYINDIYPEEIRWLGFIINYVFAKIGEMSLSMICENVDQYYVNFGYIVLCCSCLFLGYFLKDSNGYEKEDSSLCNTKSINSPELPLLDVN